MAAMIRGALTAWLLIAVYQGSRTALVIMLFLQAAASEIFVWLLQRKADK